MGRFKGLWDRGADGDHREERSFVRLVVVVAVLFLAFFSFKKDNIFRWAAARFKIRAQQEQIRRLEKQNEALENHIRALNSDRDSLETHARENFLFTEEGETLYLLDK